MEGVARLLVQDDLDRRSASADLQVEAGGGDEDYARRHRLAAPRLAHAQQAPGVETLGQGAREPGGHVVHDQDGGPEAHGQARKDGLQDGRTTP